MDSRLWRDKLRGDLTRQGLPPRYIDRFVEELAEHVADSQTEETSMEAHEAYERLGATESLAAAASQEFRRRTFAGRYPLLTFVLGPLALVPTLLVFLIVAVFGIFWAIDAAAELLARDTLSQIPEETITEVDYWIGWCFDGLVRFVPFALAAWIFCRWGQRSGMRCWPLAACGIVAVMAGLLVTKSTPAAANLPGQWMIGLGWKPNANHLLQILVPLVVCGWCLRRVPSCSQPTPACVEGIRT